MTEVPGGSLTLLGIYLMGLGLNLTPCVYAMMSVTMSLFGGQKETHHWRAFGKALVYVLGIATMYSSLGIIAAFTGEIFGVFLQSRWVLIGIALILVILSLSMFDLYTFQMPSWLLNKIGGQHRVNLFGIYLSGLFVGIFAAPCIGPPIIALLTFVGTRGDPVFAFLIFFVMSLGLGTPYLILGTFSSLLHRLPRSGVWLVWVERAFGMMLLAIAAFYAILALKPSFLKWWPAASLVLAGLYLGFIEKAGNEKASFRRFKKVAGAAAMAIGIALPLMGPRETVAWEMYTPAGLIQATESGKPVVMDFYADWCIPCHELDQFTYSDASVIQALQNFERIKVDLTQADTPELNEIINRFGIVGVPTILFLDQEGNEVEEARVTGFIPPRELLQIIRSPRLTKEILPTGEDRF
ncbi:MAG TPA: cytochrome c biogenesis protein CcdA [bacterium]|nr:cytochrome c biogenesis protein CcdA [bacterium]